MNASAKIALSSREIRTWLKQLKQVLRENIHPPSNRTPDRAWNLSLKIGINIREIRDCQNRKRFEPTKNISHQVLVA